MPWICFAVCFFLSISVLSANAEDAPVDSQFYVAVNGSDANAGTVRKPFATLARARGAVRDLKKDGLKNDVTVFVRGGTYLLDEPLEFGPADSGTAKHSVTYAAYPRERPVFSGGRTITGWKKQRGNLWTVELPRVKAGEWHFRQLFINGRRAVRARTPNHGFFRVVKAGPDRRSSFTFRAGDIKDWPGLQDVEVVFFHDWCTSRVRIEAADKKSNTVKLADPIGYSARQWGRIDSFESHPRYYLENAPELLDAPGEWHLDRKTGRLTYMAHPGEKIADAVAPKLEQLFVVRGKPGKPIRNLHFRGLSFAHCAWPLPEHGYAGSQAAFHEKRIAGGKSRGRTPAGVAASFEYAVDCSLDTCRFEHLGGSGLWLRRGCHRNQVVGNVVRDVGGNGVMIGEGDRARSKNASGTPAWKADPDMTAKGNVVSNNIIEHCGQLYYGSIGVWVGLTDGTVVAHNEIRNLPYTGVSVGWMWNTSATACKNNIVEANHIHHVMQMLSDGGGIYTLGRQPGTVLRGNDIHDIPRNAGRAESNGMFIDEGSSKILIEGNVIHAVARSSIRFHQATDNTIRDNTLFLAPRRAPFMFNACRKDTMTFENNTVLDQQLRLEKNARVGAELKCDGIASHLAVPHEAKLEPKRLTLEAWVKMSEYPTGKDTRRWIAAKNRNEWKQGHYGLIIDHTAVGAYLNIGGKKDNCHRAAGADGGLQLDKWHHLAMTYDGTDLKVYLDGALGGVTKIGKPRRPGRGAFDIGRRPDGFVCFKGLIDEVRLYSRAISADEIKQHFDAPEKIKAGGGLVGHWGFEADVSRPEKLTEISAKAGLEAAWRKRLLKADQSGK